MQPILETVNMTTQSSSQQFPYAVYFKLLHEQFQTNRQK